MIFAARFFSCLKNFKTALLFGISGRFLSTDGVHYESFI